MHIEHLIAKQFFWPSKPTVVSVISFLHQNIPCGEKIAATSGMQQYAINQNKISGNIVYNNIERKIFMKLIGIWSTKWKETSLLLKKSQIKKFSVILIWTK